MNLTKFVHALCVMCGERHPKSFPCSVRVLPVEPVRLAPLCDVCGFHHGEGRPCLHVRPLATSELRNTRRARAQMNKAIRFRKRGARKLAALVREQANTKWRFNGLSRVRGKGKGTEDVRQP